MSGALVASLSVISSSFSDNTVYRLGEKKSFVFLSQVDGWMELMENSVLRGVCVLFLIFVVDAIRRWTKWIR